MVPEYNSKKSLALVCPLNFKRTSFWGYTITNFSLKPSSVACRQKEMNITLIRQMPDTVTLIKRIRQKPEKINADFICRKKIVSLRLVL